MTACSESQSLTVSTLADASSSGARSGNAAAKQRRSRSSVPLTAAPPVTADIVVLALSVGVTVTGQSICCFGRPASLVTVKLNVFPVAHGIGAWGMFRYS